MKFRHVSLIAIIAAVGWAHPALSHAILMDSVPKLAGKAVTGEQPVTLRFNSLIDVSRSRVLLVGPDSLQQRLVLTGGGNGDTIKADVTLLPGHNVLRWQVLAIDGHITRGNVPFDVISAPAR